MNLIDAIKSGKPFRRKDGPWLIKSEHRDAFDVYPTDVSRNGAFVSPSEVIADDWEIQEPTVTITRTSFWDAYNQIAVNSIGLHSARPIVSDLARKLGLE